MRKEDVPKRNSKHSTEEKNFQQRVAQENDPASRFAITIPIILLL